MKIPSKLFYEILSLLSIPRFLTMIDMYTARNTLDLLPVVNLTGLLQVVKE